MIPPRVRCTPARGSTRSTWPARSVVGLSSGRIGTSDRAPAHEVPHRWSHGRVTHKSKTAWLSPPPPTPDRTCIACRRSARGRQSGVQSQGSIRQSSAYTRRVAAAPSATVSASPIQAVQEFLRGAAPRKLRPAPATRRRSSELTAEINRAIAVAHLQHPRLHRRGAAQNPHRRHLKASSRGNKSSRNASTTTALPPTVGPENRTKRLAASAATPARRLRGRRTVNAVTPGGAANARDVRSAGPRGRRQRRPRW